MFCLKKMIMLNYEEKYFITRKHLKKTNIIVIQVKIEHTHCIQQKQAHSKMPLTAYASYISNLYYIDIFYHLIHNNNKNICILLIHFYGNKCFLFLQLYIFYFFFYHFYNFDIFNGISVFVYIQNANKLVSLSTGFSSLVS